MEAGDRFSLAPPLFVSQAVADWPILGYGAVAMATTCVYAHLEPLLWQRRNVDVFFSIAFVFGFNRIKETS